MATARRSEYSRYDDVLDLVYSTRDWWRTIHILEHVLVFVAVLFAAVAAATLAEAHLHLSARWRWPVCIALYGYFVGGMAFLVFRPLFREWSEEEVAIHIERKYPELNNQLINAVQLGVDERVMSPAMVEALVAQAAENAGAYPVRESVSKRRALYFGVAALVATAALCIWAALSFNRFWNALQRAALPWREVKAIGSVEIVDVSPGNKYDLKSGSTLDITVRIRGGRPEGVEGTLFYRYGDQDEPLEKPMERWREDLYICRVGDVKTPFDYHVNIGGTESDRYEIRVIEHPVITDREVRPTYPKYTGKKNEPYPMRGRQIKAPIGSVIALKLTTSKRIEEAKIRFENSDKPEDVEIGENRRELVREFAVVGDVAFRFYITDEDGLANLNPRLSQILAERDRAPTIQFKEPRKKEVTLNVGDPLDLAIEATDDYGISEVFLYARRGNDPERLIKAWTRKDFPSPQRVRLPYRWELGDEQLGYQAGDEIEYYAVARDNHARVAHTRVSKCDYAILSETLKPNETKIDPPYKVKLVDKVEVAKEKREKVRSWETALRAVLEDQLAARSRVAGLDKETKLGALQHEGGEIAKTQADIFARSVTIAKGIEPTEKELQEVKDILTHLAYKQMTHAARTAQAIAKLDKLNDLKTAYGKLSGTQDEIIRALRRLLNILPELATGDDKDQADEEDVEDFPDEEDEGVKDLLKNLKDMVREKKKVMETTDELAKLPKEDYTPEDEKKLEDCKAIEEKWEQFLKAKISDLSKMQEQDFANTNLLDELVEIHSEVEMAKDALASKATEIATALEDNGLMLAEKLTKQLEKWLPDTPDRDRWQMEEPLTDGYETPMAELPKELEDLVGDLMEEEEDLQQEIEDATSAWADSMDAAGWDAMDGPISNFAANGVTGNRLPNSNELSGRSGEGRQGQSVGEMVENQFDGKGGRRTPTRLTPEPYQKGQVKDTSQTPPGGATGGGKTGGASGEGLEGPPPPDIEMKMKGFALKQAQIRNKAEKIALNFKILDYPPIFEPTVKDMKMLEAALNSGRYGKEARRRFNVLLRNLKGTRMYVQGDIAVERDPTKPLPPHLEKEMRDTAGDKVPEEFKPLIKQYYDAITKTR